MTLTALDTAIAEASRDAVAGGFTLKVRLGWRLYAEVCILQSWENAARLDKPLPTVRHRWVSVVAGCCLDWTGHHIDIDDHLAPDDFLIEGVRK